MNSTPAPTALTYRREARLLDVTFPDGVRFSLPAEYLRVESPSAEVKGHGLGQKVTVPGKRLVGVIGIEPVGTYAVLIAFDDQHKTGIFTWDYLRALGEEQAVRWAAYQQALTDKQLSRDPKPR